MNNIINVNVNTCNGRYSNNYDDDLKYFKKANRNISK